MTPISYYYIIEMFSLFFSLHTEMDENRCTNGIIRVAKNTENIPCNFITNKKIHLQRKCPFTLKNSLRRHESAAT